jgi:hypothetical protein
MKDSMILTGNLSSEQETLIATLREQNEKRNKQFTVSPHSDAV